MTGSMIARVEELIRRAEAVERRGATERSRTLASRLRATVLRPLADLGDASGPRAVLVESPAADLEESVFELAMDLTRACAIDQRAALLEACAGAQYLVTVGQGSSHDRITKLAELARDVPGDASGRIRVRNDG